MYEKHGNRLVQGSDCIVDALNVPTKLPKFLVNHYKNVLRNVIQMELNTSPVSQFWPFLISR